MRACKHIIISITLMLIMMLFLSACQTCLCQENKPGTIPTFVECWGPQASFPGGRDSMQAFLERNINWPAAFDGSGRVIVKFTISTTGRISNPLILHSLCSDCDKEVLRVISIMPNWKPAIKKGKPIETTYMLPISFTLN